MSQNLSFVAFVIGALRVNKFSYFVANNICYGTEYRLGNDSLLEHPHTFKLTLIFRCN